MSEPQKNFGMEGAISDTVARTASREMHFGEAIRDALVTAMRMAPEVFIVGEGITDSGGVFGTTIGLREEFGEKRVIESPLSENAVTGICAGAALGGLRPVMVHQRIDFTLLAADQIINHAAKWRYMYNGRVQVPFVIRCIVGKGWGQAAQHSQSLQALFAHIPGLKVVMPTNAYDAKGMLLAAIFDGNPVIFIENRLLFNERMHVPAGDYRVPLGKAVVRRPGRDITLIGVSYQVPVLMEVAKRLAPKIEAEVIDLRSASPLDRELLSESVSRTGRAAIVDTGWQSYGLSAEISACLHEACFEELKAPVLRIALPDVPTPCSHALEKVFYPDAEQIHQKILNLFSAHFYMSRDI